MIADNLFPEIPGHMADIISRYAENSGRSYEQAALHLLGTMRKLVKDMDEGEIEGVMARLKDGTVDEVLF